ncbi:MAG TPA: cation diffusion facilitator family transporter [Candidatus Limnocylindrales bacterium]|nr:cation diffusion facilitator family transporter [Candidatus Limnocylindrales bacterium]
MPHSHSAAGRHARNLAATLGLGVLILVVEIVAGIAANSLALLADAGHMFADVSGVALSLGAVWVAARPPSLRRSFGLYRLEIVAAAANAILLLGITIVVVAEALERFAHPPDVEPGIIIVVAIVALAANVVSLRLLSSGRHESLTVRGAYLEVAGDLLGSASVLVAGVVVFATGWREADAVASLVVAALIVPRTIALLRDSIDVLLEASPKGIDLDEVRAHILRAPGVGDVHDLHAWTITSGMNVVSAHVVLTPDAEPGDVLDELGECLSDDFDVNHSTFQLETPDHVRWEARAARAQH